MERFGRSELKELLEQRGPACVCVSIYMPVVRAAGADIQQNPVRLRNLLREARERLVAGGLRSPEAMRLLSPVEDLTGNVSFWLERGDGLAVFVSRDVFHYYRLPYRFQELAVVTTPMPVWRPWAGRP